MNSAGESVFKLGSFAQAATLACALALCCGGVVAATAQEGEGEPYVGEPDAAPDDPDVNMSDLLDGFTLGEGADDEAESEPETPPNETPEERMDRLFVELAAAPDSAEAAFVAEEIEAVWRAQSDPTVRLLNRRALAAAGIGDATLARQLADGAIALSEEQSAEAYVRSAEIALVSDDIARVILDLEAAVRLDARRYDALLTLAGVFERLERFDGAMAAYDGVLALYPEHEFAKGRRETLAREVEGIDL